MSKRRHLALRVTDFRGTRCRVCVYRWTIPKRDGSLAIGRRVDPRPPERLTRGMQGRVLFVVGVVAIFVATMLRLLWPTEEFSSGFSLALQLSGILLLAIYGVRHFTRRRVTEG